jgi:hypothetical protein
MGWKEAIYTYPSSIVYEIHVGIPVHFDPDSFTCFLLYLNLI